ncbi:hypothetical protein [Kitasatospora sp. SUK 42]|uniref:hypothetical protein n=1 Tax=Kitasatospora sp. SUK 42 TaxID=1588882 RepID=UPI0018CB5F3E|nr:hypothetical protein [Kitasatospora sp. SUK 42]MBV2155066.1 hypothetical protein [Kitasatospora sp. SUK 42]
MTEMIEIPDVEGDWEPATELQAGGRNPARQASMFQSAAWPLRSLALLSVDLDAVARRLKLTIETSWDGHGSVRAAFFVLDGTDFVVTHHEGDPPGTHVWTRKGGPADPATRAGSLLAALSVGPEAVSYSTWGAGTDLAHMPDAWWRGRSKPEWSRQDIWEAFKTRPGMYVGGVSFGAVVGFLNGYDTASEGALLDGFQEWLATKLGYGWNLVYWALAEKMIFPDGRPEEPWSPETEKHAATELIRLLDEFFDHLANDPKDRP